LLKLETIKELPAQMPLECPECDVMIGFGDSTGASATVAASSSFIVTTLAGMSSNIAYGFINMI
jgi:hypothetical protein